MDLYRSHTMGYRGTQPCKVSNSGRGSSFINLCVGMSLGMVLIVIALYDDQHLKKSILALGPHLDRVEKTREILQFLGDDLRLSGYRGPRTRDGSFPVYLQVDPNSYPFIRQDRAIFGCASFNRCAAPFRPQAKARSKAHSPILIIYNIPQCHQRSAKSMQDPSEVIKLEHPTLLSAGSVVLISDGLSADIFIASAVQGQSLFHAQTPYTNRRNFLSKAYPKGSEVVGLQTVAYYLGIPLRSKSDNKTFSLYRDDGCHGAEEISEGIVAMHLEYALLDPKGMRFAGADSLSEPDWCRICGVRLQIDFQQGPSWRYDFAIRNGPRAHPYCDHAESKQSGFPSFS